MSLKICYVLPKYVSNDATHFSHIHDFLKEVSKFFNIFLIIEKGNVPPKTLGYQNIYLLHFSFLPFRVLETFLILFWVRIQGYSNFYIHYSFMSAFLASFFGKTFYWNCGEPWKYKRNFIREFFERSVYKTITHLVTGAPSLADEYSRVYGIKRTSILVMPNWIDLNRFKNYLSKEEARNKLNLTMESKIVLFVHHLSPRKGSRMILPVVSNVVAKYPNVIFLIIGSGPDEKFLKNEIVKRGLIKNVMFFGAIPNHKLPIYFIASDVFFMPSEEEGFPRVLLEAMAFGLPFVASDVGAVREIIPKKFFSNIIKYEDAPGFSGAISLLLEQPKQEEIMTSKELKEWVKNYNITNIVGKFIKLF